MSIDGQIAEDSSDGNYRSARFGIISIFFDKYFGSGLFTLVVQQIAVGLSVLFLARVAGSDPATENFFLYLAAYIITLVFPYFPGLLSYYFFDLWKVCLTKRFQEVAWKRHPYRATDFANVRVGSERTAIFANTGPAVIGDLCHYVVDVLSTSLNSALSIAAIALVVDLRVAASYVFSLFACAAYTILFASVAEHRSQTVESKRLALVAHNEKLWPHLTLANRLSSANWRRSFEELYFGFLASLRSEKRVKYSSALALSMLSVLPTSFTILMIVGFESSTTASKVVLLVSLPRVFQLLTMLGQFSSLLFEWNHVKGRFGILKSFFQPVNGSSAKIDFKAIQIALNGVAVSFQGASDLLASAKADGTGRYFISGRNGSGRTTLLLHLKEGLGDQAFYLPPISELMLEDMPINRSTGERKLAEIKAILSDAQIRYLLLDEWDGNLDAGNTEQIDRLLNEASRRIAILEVRHRVK